MRQHTSVSDLSRRDGWLLGFFFLLSLSLFFLMEGCIARLIILVFLLLFFPFFMEGGCSFVSCLLSSSPFGGRLLIKLVLLKGF